MNNKNELIKRIDKFKMSLNNKHKRFTKNDLKFVQELNDRLQNTNDDEEYYIIKAILNTQSLNTNVIYEEVINNIEGINIIVNNDILEESGESLSSEDYNELMKFVIENKLKVKSSVHLANDNFRIANDNEMNEICDKLYSLEATYNDNEINKFFNDKLINYSNLNFNKPKFYNIEVTNVNIREEDDWGNAYNDGPYYFNVDISFEADSINTYHPYSNNPVIGFAYIKNNRKIEFYNHKSIDN